MPKSPATCRRSPRSPDVGGWVIRMGDPSMVALPSMPNVLDYCHSDLRADWMDVFIAAHCRFMIGTSSGPAYVPPLYGVPSVLTNWWPPAQRPWHPSTFSFQNGAQIGDGRLLTLSETLREPFSYCHSLTYLEMSKTSEWRTTIPKSYEQRFGNARAVGRRGSRPPTWPSKSAPTASTSE